MTKSLITSILGTQLKFELVNLDDNTSETETIDFEEVLALLGQLESDPVHVVSEILKIKFAVERIYLHYRDKQKSLQMDLNHFEAKLRDVYTRNDSTNPLFGEKKLTVAVVDAEIKTDDEYIRRENEIEVYNSYRSQLGAIKEILIDTVSLTSALISAPHLFLQEHGNSVDRQEIGSIANRLMRFSEDGE